MARERSVEERAEDCRRDSAVFSIKEGDRKYCFISNGRPTCAGEEYTEKKEMLMSAPLPLNIQEGLNKHYICNFKPKSKEPGEKNAQDKI